MANVTGSWQHYLGLFSQKGHHHRAKIKSPGMLFFEMAKRQKSRQENSNSDVN